MRFSETDLRALIEGEVRENYYILNTSDRTSFKDEQDKIDFLGGL